MEGGSWARGRGSERPGGSAAIGLAMGLTTRRAVCRCGCVDLLRHGHGGGDGKTDLPLPFTSFCMSQV
eukprot:365077-Chlamydomonas_euryale.AAC.12